MVPVSCEIISRGRDILVTSKGRKEWAPGQFKTVLARPQFRISPEGEPAEIGEAILDALSSYHEPVLPRELDFREYCKSVGVKSWAAILRETKVVTAEICGNEIRLSPMVPGEGTALYGSGDEAVSCSRQPDAIGGSLIELLVRMDDQRSARLKSN